MISAGERSQTHALDRAATGTGILGMFPGELYLLHVFESAPSLCLFSVKVETLKPFSRFKSLRGQRNTIGKLEIGNKEQMLVNIPS